MAGEQGQAVLVLAAEAVTAESLASLSALSGGTARLIVTARRAAALGLQAPLDQEEGAGVVALVPAEAGPGRILELADPTARREALRSPPKVELAPVALARPAIELAKLARLLPSVLIAELTGDAAQDLKDWAVTQELLFLTTGDIAHYNFAAPRSLSRVAEARVPLIGAEDARVIAFRPQDGGEEHLALVIGQPDPEQPLLVRLHSQCFTGDVLGSLRCDCGDQLRGAIEAIAKDGAGMVLYLAQEGRGIGLVNKLRAYSLQDLGADTAEANETLGFDADERLYLPAAEMLRQLGFGTVRLLTNNPEKVAGLARCGITIAERVPHRFPSNGHNEFYLATKASRFGHLF